MPAPTCYESIQLVAVRAVRLDDDGSILVGADNAYQSAAPISIAVTYEYEAGADIVQKNGSGQLCLTYRGEDKLKNVTLAMNLCQLDFQFIELLTGWPALTDLEGEIVGISAPALTAPNRNGVSLEGWSLAWDSSEQAVSGSNPLYIRHVFPRVKLNVGNHTIDEGALIVPVEGQGFTNSVLAGDNGPSGDWPEGIEGPWASFLDPSIVVAQCNYLSTPTGS
jgi:hypothetical protein